MVSLCVSALKRVGWGSVAGVHRQHCCAVLEPMTVCMVFSIMLCDRLAGGEAID
jgi:hypothetical protein